MRPLLLALGLAACAPLPGPAVPPQGPAPDLVPLGGLLAAGDDLAAQASPAPEVTAAAAALTARAGAFPRAPGARLTDTTANREAEDRARAEALAVRAAALRGAVLTPAELIQLREGPSLQ